MATVQNTIEIVQSSHLVALAAATRLELNFGDVTIGEIVSRVFKSVTMEVTVRDSVTVAASMSSWLLGIKITGGTASDVTTTATLVNSGDNQSFQFTRDVTSWFNTNFTGPTHALTLCVNFGGVITLPISMKLIITYEYDDSMAALDTGTVTSLTGGTALNDTSKSWTADQWHGCYIHITSGPGAGIYSWIGFSDSDTLSGTTTLTGVVAGNTYEILPGRTKTVRLPIEGPTAQLTASLASLGTNQIPNIGTFLPEAGKDNYKIWIESEYNDGGNAATDFNLAISFDAAAESPRGTLEMALISSGWGKDIYLVSLTTTATHDIKARSSLASRFSLLAPMLVITYSYNAAATTRVIQSLVIPVDAGAGLIGTSANNLRQTIEVMIEEPGTITMVHSGILLRCYDSTTVSLSLKAGAQSARAYALTTGSAQVGPYTLMHRIDSGSAQGAALTLARGLNTIDIDFYASSAGTGFACSGWLFLNYTSDVHADGERVHNRSLHYNIADMDATLGVYRVATPNRVFSIPETDWYMNSLGYSVQGWLNSTIVNALTLDVQVLSGEDPPGDGFVMIGNSNKRDDGEASVHLFVFDATKLFQRHSGDPDVRRLALETTRDYRLTSNTADWGITAWLTKHSITNDVVGDISGFSGDGSGIAVDVHRTDGNKERILALTTAVGGGFSGTWFDDTIDVAANAAQDATHTGRSANDTAV